MQRLDFLRPVLSLLENNIDVLLALGGAVEELLHPDLDIIGDTLVDGEFLCTTDAVKADAVDDRTESWPTAEKVIGSVGQSERFASDGGKENQITRQVLATVDGGCSFGVTLISAQQFLSAMHRHVTGNNNTKIIGRTGSSEVNPPDYRFLDQDIRSVVIWLGKGELPISHAVDRQPVKVIFPLPAYRQEGVL